MRILDGISDDKKEIFSNKNRKQLLIEDSM